MINDEKKELIAYEIIRTLYSRFTNFPENSSQVRNAPFHIAFLKAFTDKLENKASDLTSFIGLSSWMHGLNTTLGQAFFENVARILSCGEKKSFTKRTNTVLEITAKQKNTIANIITDLKNGNEVPDLSRENGLLLSTSADQIMVEANDFTADVFYQLENAVVGIELKTVRPNSGEMRSEKQKILEAKSVLFHEYVGKEIIFFIGFPFDPTGVSDLDFDKSRFLKYLVDGEKYFDDKEVLLAGELWDFLSESSDTMQEILKLINAIATPKFMDDYEFVKDPINEIKDSVRYRSILAIWYLSEQLRLLENHEIITKNLAIHKNFGKFYNQTIFDDDGNCNYKRLSRLNELISK